MNLLFLLEPYRGHGYGKEMVAFWEKQMREAGYKRVLTSTLSSEGAQHFYRKLGYADCGALLLPGEPLEIFSYKGTITNKNSAKFRAIFYFTFLKASFVLPKI